VKRVENMKVCQCIKTNIPILTKEDSMSLAIDYFLNEDIDLIPVINKHKKLLGVLTKNQMLRCMKSKISMDMTIDKIVSNQSELIIKQREITNVNEISKNLIVVDDNNEVLGLLNPKETISKIQKLTKKLDAVIESSYDGIYITDGEAKTLRINKSYERITGVKREEMLDNNMVQLVESGYISQSATMEVLKTGKTTTLEQKFKTGKKALVTSTPIYDDNKQIIMVVTNVRDVTELVKLNEQLLKNKELAQKYFSEIEEMRLQLIDDFDLVAKDEKMLDILKICKRVAKVDTTVLLLGETGVGKEEVAKYIHKNSNRCENQFIKVNCGAIPENLIESELFGYEKGAFTGAVKEGKMGMFEIADGGTIFLDEVGELPLKMQVKLLRVLQEQEFTRVGGTIPINIDVRILAATNRNLEEMVKDGVFREDLYYRLSVIPITILPLRERKKDIFALGEYFLKGLNEKYNLDKTLDNDALKSLFEYNWPGNVRELKNIVERVFVMSYKDKIGESDLPSNIRNVKDVDILSSDRIIHLKDAVAKVEIDLIKKSFDKYKNVRDASKALGVDASTFVRKRKKYVQMGKFPDA
jgi:PAS domain S-box-containing protein